MTYSNAAQQGGEVLPGWVPSYAVQYLDHTEKGISIRELARKANCHASTVLRQIRRVEARRDDPLIDAALLTLGARVADVQTTRFQVMGLTEAIASEASLPSEARLNAEARKVLSELIKPGAVLAVAPGMARAAIVHDETAKTHSERSSVDRLIAEAMALKDWISCIGTGRVSRYRITPEGRAVLIKLHAACENQRQGFQEKQSSFTGATDAEAGAPRMRFHTAESPLTLLARRKDKDGNPFLSVELVRVGERLREDFELAQIDTNDSDHSRSASQIDHPATVGNPAAKQRLNDALDVLGEGLSDIAVRCCCLMEGIESTEKFLGWPARSGKIVLRIALIRLNEHYRSLAESQSDLIG